jgi:hypothetical protein
MPYKAATHEELQEGFLEPREWTGYEVYDPLGQKMGRAQEIFANANGEPEYIRVKMGFFGSKSVLIPVHLAAADMEQRVIKLR